MKWKKFKEKLKNFFDNYVFNYTNTCLICNRETIDGCICKYCEKQIKKIENHCYKCGRESGQICYGCIECQGRANYIKKSYTIYNYDGHIRYLIEKMKYRRAKYICDYFATEMASIIKHEFKDVDVLVYIPSHLKKDPKRDYNQTQVMAERIGEILNIDVEHDFILRTKECENQNLLNRFDRLKNVINCFKIRDKTTMNNKNILVIEDVITTGATINEITKELSKSGAKSINVLAIASTKLKISKKK